MIFGYELGSVAMQHYRIVEGKPVTAPRQIAIGRRAADSLKNGDIVACDFRGLDDAVGAFRGRGRRRFGLTRREHEEK